MSMMNSTISTFFRDSLLSQDDNINICQLTIKILTTKDKNDSDNSVELKR